MTNPSQLGRQYAGLKRLHPDALVFIRLGGFYEAFGEDAKIAAKALNLPLNHNGMCGKTLPRGMCGFPVSTGERYAEQLVAAGYTVALASEVSA